MFEMTGNGFGSMFDVDLRVQQELGASFFNSTKFSIATEPKSQVTLYFPNTNHDTDKIIDCRKYKRLSDLDKPIEHALQNTKIPQEYVGKHDDKGLKMAIRDHDMNATFKIWGVRNEHTYYVYWLTIFNRYNTVGYLHDPLVNIPVLFEMDGMGTMLNIVALHTLDDVLMPLNLLHIAMETCPLIELFTCERRHTKPEAGYNIQTTILKQAEHCIRNVTLDQEIMSIEIPYDEDEDTASIKLSLLNDNNNNNKDLF